MRHLIDIQELSTKEIAELISVAEDIIANPANEENVTRIKNYLAVNGAKA